MGASQSKRDALFRPKDSTCSIPIGSVVRVEKVPEQNANSVPAWTDSMDACVAETGFVAGHTAESWHRVMFPKLSSTAIFVENAIKVVADPAKEDESASATELRATIAVARQALKDVFREVVQQRIRAKNSTRGVGTLSPGSFAHDNEADSPIVIVYHDEKKDKYYVANPTRFAQYSLSAESVIPAKTMPTPEAVEFSEWVETAILAECTRVVQNISEAQIKLDDEITRATQLATTLRGKKARTSLAKIDASVTV